jgi:hydrogenase nickel incorporation protein HypA/HybF
MHEFSIAESIIKIIKKEAGNNGFKRIKAVILKIGVLRSVVPQALKEAFKIAGKGTVVENAKLGIKSVPFKMVCAKCESIYRSSNTSGIASSCRKCGSKDVEIRSGNELIIESIEGD